MRRYSRDGLDWYRAKLPGATACFTTRRGGSSIDPYDSLNLGTMTGDRPGSVLENRKRAAAALGLEGDRMKVATQVHGSGIVRHLDPSVAGSYLNPEADQPEADGHMTSLPGVPLLVLVADCLPIAVKGPGGLAMLHCGWRGLAGTLIEKAVSMTGGGAAAIGPGIGPCCFEVGPDVAGSFPDVGEGVFADGRCDLPEIARRKLRSAGVEAIEMSGVCTFCDQRDFFSYRRDGGLTGRQAGIAWVD